MKWHFIRFYIGIVVVLLIAAGVFYVFVRQDYERKVDERIERFAAPYISRIRAEMEKIPEDAEDPAALINAADFSPKEPPRGERHRRPPPPIELVPRDGLALPAEDLTRLDNGDIVAIRDGEKRLVYAAVSEANVAVFESTYRRSRDRDEGTSGFLVLLAPPLGILLLIGVATYLLIRPIERRISSLTEVTRNFGAGALDARAQVGRTGTVDELEESFNAMAARIEELVGGQQELLRAVSHDLRTPLARVFFALDDAQTAADAQEKNRHLERIDRSMVELNDLVEELTTFLHLDESGTKPVREWIDVSPVIQYAQDLVLDFRKEVALEVSCSEHQVFAELRYLKRAVANLVTNAIMHAEKGVWISCRSEKDAFVLTVDDDGPGIPEEERGRIFEPFYRRERSRNMNLGGSGLGLAIVARIMAAHGGTAAVSDGPHGGARFTLSFPCATESSDSSSRG